MKFDSRETITFAVLLFLEYLLYPYFQSNKKFLGMTPLLWVVLPGIVALAVYLLWNNESVTEKFKKILAKEETTTELVDPLQRFEEFENTRARAMLRKPIIKSWISVKDKWVYIIEDTISTKLVVLNAIPGTKLNPFIIDERSLKKIGYDNIKDYKRSEKARTLYDLLTANPDLDITKLGDVVNE